MITAYGQADPDDKNKLIQQHFYFQREGLLYNLFLLPLEL